MWRSKHLEVTFKEDSCKTGTLLLDKVIIIIIKTWLCFSNVIFDALSITNQIPFTSAALERTIKQKMDCTFKGVNYRWICPFFLWYNPARGLGSKVEIENRVTNVCSFDVFTGLFPDMPFKSISAQAWLTETIKPVSLGDACTAAARPVGTQGDAVAVCFGIHCA